MGAFDFLKNFGGRENAQVKITTAEELTEFAFLVNGGNSFKGKTVVLANDINLKRNNENQWIPIGINRKNSFRGTFDGNGRVVSGVYVNAANEFSGFFGYCRGNVKNLCVLSEIKGKKSVGGLVGKNDGKIERCYTTASVWGNGGLFSKARVGGLAGENTGKIENCFATGNVTGTKADIGGLVGKNDGKIENCYSTCGVEEKNACTGRLVGDSGGKIENCYALASTVATLVGRHSCGSTTVSPNLGIKTKEQMTQSETFHNWDFNGVWIIDPKINDGFPYLRTPSSA